MTSVHFRAHGDRSGTFGPFPFAMGILRCVRSMPARPGGDWVRYGVFGPFPCALADVGCPPSTSVRSGDYGVLSGSFCPFPCTIGSIPVRSWILSGTFGPFLRALWIIGSVRSIPVRPGGDRVRSSCYAHSRAPWWTNGAFLGIDRIVRVLSDHSCAKKCGFGEFPGVLGVVGFVRVRSVDSRAPVRSRAFGPFPCALGVVGCVRLIPARPWGSRVPFLVSSCTLACVRSIPVRPGGRRNHLGAFGPFPWAMVVVGFVPVRSVHSHAHRVRRVRTGAFGPFPFALGILRVVRVPSFHCRTPVWWSVTFGDFGSFPSYLGGVRFLLVRSVDFRAPCVSSGSFVCVWYIPVRHWCGRVSASALV